MIGYRLFCVDETKIGGFYLLPGIICQYSNVQQLEFAAFRYFCPEHYAKIF